MSCNLDSVSLREEEEDKVLEAMLKKKGENIAASSFPSVSLLCRLFLLFRPLSLSLLSLAHGLSHCLQTLHCASTASLLSSCH